MFSVGNPQETTQTTTSMLFNNDIATVMTIQFHFSTFWGTFCKIWLFLWKKIIGLILPLFCKGPFLCSSISRKNIASRAMKVGRKLPYRRLFPIHISLFDKHIMHRFQNFQCKGRLPLPPKSLIFSDMLQFEFYVGSMKSNDKMKYLWFHQLRL